MHLSLVNCVPPLHHLAEFPLLSGFDAIDGIRCSPMAVPFDVVVVVGGEQEISNSGSKP